MITILLLWNKISAATTLASSLGLSIFSNKLVKPGEEIFILGTYKFFCDWEVIEELDTAKVISSGHSSARVAQVGRVHVCLVSIFGPNSDYLITKHTTAVQYNNHQRPERERGRGRGRGCEGRQIDTYYYIIKKIKECIEGLK